METTLNTTVEFAELLTDTNRFEFILIGAMSLRVIDHKYGTSTTESMCSGFPLPVFGEA